MLLFIVYYVIDNSGYKLARDGRWPVWEGIWLSSAVLLPLGIFFTKTAVNDSAVFNADAYSNFMRRLFGSHEVRKLELKEVVIDEVEASEAVSRIAALRATAQQFLQTHTRQGYVEYFTRGYDSAAIAELSQQLDSTVDYLSNSRDQMVLGKAMDYPVIGERRLCHLTSRRWLGIALAVLFPVGALIYLLGLRQQRALRHDVAAVVRDLRWTLS